MSPSRSGRTGTLFASVPVISHRAERSGPTTGIIHLEFTVATTPHISAGFKTCIVIRNAKGNNVSPKRNMTNGCQRFTLVFPLNGHALPASERGRIVRDVVAVVHGYVLTCDHSSVNGCARSKESFYLLHIVCQLSPSRSGTLGTICARHRCQLFCNIIIGFQRINGTRLDAIVRECATIVFTIGEG